MNKYIKNLKKFINNLLMNYNNKIFKRNSKITFKDIFYCSVYMNGNKTSYDLTNSHLKIKNIINVSKSALVKKRNKIHPIHYELINTKLINHIYDKYNKSRHIAVDGANIYLEKCLHKDGVKLSKNKQYTKVLISSLYDIDNKIPINYTISKQFNERKLLTSQLKYIKKGDIIVMDRGYIC